MEQIPGQNKDEEKEIIENKAFSTKDELSFDEFVSKRKNGMNMYNNFFALFLKEGMLADLLRGQEFFTHFQNENKEFEESLTKRISEWRDTENSVTDATPEDILRDLYKAYKIMLSYDEIKTNNDLFE